MHNSFYFFITFIVLFYRSGSMPGQTESRYSSRRNSGDHVNMNGVTPGTPQLPPRTYRPPNHGRQRSQ